MVDGSLFGTEGYFVKTKGKLGIGYVKEDGILGTHLFYEDILDSTQQVAFLSLSFFLKYLFI